MSLYGTTESEHLRMRREGTRTPMEAWNGLVDLAAGVPEIATDADAEQICDTLGAGSARGRMRQLHRAHPFEMFVQPKHSDANKLEVRFYPGKVLLRSLRYGRDEAEVLMEDFTTASKIPLKWPDDPSGVTLSSVPVDEIDPETSGITVYWLRLKWHGATRNLAEAEIIRQDPVDDDPRGEYLCDFIPVAELQWAHVPGRPTLYWPRQILSDNPTVVPPPMFAPYIIQDSATENLYLRIGTGFLHAPYNTVSGGANQIPTRCRKEYKPEISGFEIDDPLNGTHLVLQKTDTNIGCLKVTLAMRESTVGGTELVTGVTGKGGKVLMGTAQPSITTTVDPHVFDIPHNGTGASGIDNHDFTETHSASSTQSAHDHPAQAFYGQLGYHIDEANPPEFVVFNGTTATATPPDDTELVRHLPAFKLELDDDGKIIDADSEWHLPDGCFPFQPDTYIASLHSSERSENPSL